MMQLRGLRLGFGMLLLLALGSVPATWCQAVSATLLGSVGFGDRNSHDHGRYESGVTVDGKKAWS